jgi:hypothetical protein
MQENNQPREAFNPKEQFKRLQNLITTVLACLKNLSKNLVEYRDETNTFTLHKEFVFVNFEEYLSKNYDKNDIQNLLNQIEPELNQELDYNLDLKEKIALLQKRLDFLNILEERERAIGSNFSSFNEEVYNDIQLLKWFRRYFSTMSFKMHDNYWTNKRISLSKRCGEKIESLEIEMFRENLEKGQAD